MAASSDNMASTIDPFLLRHSFSDYFWPNLPETDQTLSKSIYHDHDFNLLLQPQQQQQLPYNQYQNQNQQFSPFSSSDLEQQMHKPTPSASDPETATTPKRRSTAATQINGKARITKRKSRATKKNQTTFITADPANFRQMVQQVTGIRFDASASSSHSHLLHKPVGRFYDACLPALDTSSFLLNQSQNRRSIYGTNIGVAAQSANGESGGSGGYGAADGFASFPTLESWKVM